MEWRRKVIHPPVYGRFYRHKENGHVYLMTTMNRLVIVDGPKGTMNIGNCCEYTGFGGKNDEFYEIEPV